MFGALALFCWAMGGDAVGEAPVVEAAVVATPQAPAYTLLAGVEIPAPVLPRLQALAEAYLAATGKPLVITDGTRRPETQAALMLRNLERGDDIVRNYANRVLAGRLPFHEVHGKHIAAMLTRHIYNEPTQLADAAATANIPPGVAAVVESALRKDPAQRPQTMLEFAEALRAAAGGASRARGTRGKWV